MQTASLITVNTKDGEYELPIRVEITDLDKLVENLKNDYEDITSITIILCPIS